MYLRRPDKAQAAEYAIACGDGELIQSAVEAAGREALQQGQLDTLHRWLAAVEGLETAPTPELLLLRALCCERAGEWQEALELAGQAAARQDAEEACRAEAQLLVARVTRERVSPERSLELLDRLMPSLQGRRQALAALRRQGLELWVYSLLDLGRYEQALALVLRGLEEYGANGRPEEARRVQELAVICYFSMGEYRRAMQAYVVLRGGGAGGGAAPYIDLYLAVSGRARAAFSRLNRVREELPAEISRTELETLLYIQALVERIAALEGESSPAPGAKALPSGSLTHRDRLGGNLGNSLPVLFRALRERPMHREEEDALFALGRGRLNIIRDGAKWLAVRRRVLRGDRERALELCRRAKASASASGQEEAGRRSAFLAFLDLEEALLLRGDDPGEAAALAGHWAAFLAENHLVCPGLTGEERAALEALLPRQAQAPEPLPQPADPRAEDWSEARVTVRCFGFFQVLLPDGSPLPWRTRKAQELFAYLFHLNGAAVARERLLDVLWPQSSPSGAASLFHTTLYNIRKCLAPYGLDQIIRREKQGYRMDMERVLSPRARLEELCAAGAEGTEELPALYLGPYLEDIEGSWAADSRAWYMGTFLRACRGTARRLMDGGEYRGAAGLLQAALAQEPYDEELAGRLIRCYAALGEIRNAMAVYARLSEILSQDLETQPGEEVTRIYKECLLRQLGGGRTRDEEQLVPV